MLSTDTGPVMPNSASNTYGSMANTPSSSAPPLCGYSSAITCAGRRELRRDRDVRPRHVAGGAVGAVREPVASPLVHPVLRPGDRPCVRRGPVQIAGAARVRHGEPALVGGQLHPVAHEPTVTAHLRRRGERHEVAARFVGAQQLRGEIHGEHGVVEPGSVVGQLLVEIGEPRGERADQPRRLRIVDRRLERADRVLHLVERLLDQPDRVDVEATVDDAELLGVDHAQRGAQIDRRLGRRARQTLRGGEVLCHAGHQARRQRPRRTERIVGTGERRGGFVEAGGRRRVVAVVDEFERRSGLSVARRQVVTRRQRGGGRAGHGEHAEHGGERKAPPDPAPNAGAAPRQPDRQHGCPGRHADDGRQPQEALELRPDHHVHRHTDHGRPHQWHVSTLQSDPQTRRRTPPARSR